MNEDYLEELCKKAFERNNIKEVYEKIANFLEKDKSKIESFWYYNGIPILLQQEILTIYDGLIQDDLTPEEGILVSSVLNLIQTCMSVESVKQMILDSYLPLYIYPFIYSNGTSEAHENIRIASLGVIGTLIKEDSKDIINYIRGSEVIPIILKAMDIGSETSKLIAASIFLQIITYDETLSYACQSFDKYVAIYTILNSIILQCISTPNEKLIEIVIDCYIRMCKIERVRNSLATRKPDALSTPQIKELINRNKRLIEKANIFQKIITNTTVNNDFL